MKRLLILLILIGTATTATAQRIGRGFSFGADRDSLMYIIASPFDNWYINVSGGIQTFIGNTPDPLAYWNTADFGTRIEIGKWIIPDFSASLRLGLATVHSQSRHGGNNPWTDLSNPIIYEGVEYGPYYPIKANSFSFMGIITFDWTNFLNGYGEGKRRHFHFYTPFGLGGMMMFGKIINQNFVNRINNDPTEENVELGDIRRNFELDFTGGIMAEYYASKHVSLNAAIELLWARGSIDDYNYNLDADKRRIDLVPSFYVGAKFNLLKNVKKYNRFTRKSSIEKVNHEFLAFGTSETIPRLIERIEVLNGKIDSVQTLSISLLQGADDNLKNIILERDNLQNQLDSLENYQPKSNPLNVIDELLDMNEVLGLPSCIVYYELDKYNLDYNARKTLQKFAKDMSKMDDTLEFFIIGAADSLTGTVPHNQWLSEKRCQAAYDMLTQHFGADKNQLRMEPVGGILEYYPKENNRMALIILRTPVTEEIVERWRRKR